MMPASLASQPLDATQDLDDWRTWRLNAPLIFRTVIAPAGFATDGASIPREFWAILPAWGRYSRPAVVHDYLCSTLDQGGVFPDVPDRKTADAWFFDAMVDCSVNTNVRWIMWAAVRLYAIIARK